MKYRILARMGRGERLKAPTDGGTLHFELSERPERLPEKVGALFLLRRNIYENRSY